MVEMSKDIEGRKSGCGTSTNFSTGFSSESLIYRILDENFI